MMSTQPKISLDDGRMPHFMKCDAADFTRRRFRRHYICYSDVANAYKEYGLICAAH